MSKEELVQALLQSQQENADLKQQLLAMTVRHDSIAGMKVVVCVSAKPHGKNLLQRLIPGYFLHAALHAERDRCC